MDYRPNPPWVDRIVRRHSPALSELVPREWVPDSMEGGKYEEYGCGHYGCVLPVPDGRVVLKITSDPSEAAFVAAYMSLPDKPVGIIRYHRIVELPELYRRRPTYAIWRDEAENVGEIHQAAKQRYADRYGHRTMSEFLRLLIQFKDKAAAVRKIVIGSKNQPKLLEEAKRHENWAWRTFANDRPISSREPAPQRVAFIVRQLEVIAEEMGSTAMGYLIGQAFESLLEQGILLADVHTGNIGDVQLEDYTTWELVVTDPGHMVPLDPKWLQVAIPQL